MNTEVLHIGLRDSGKTRVVRLSGELDAYSSDRLRTIADTWLSGVKKVVVNLDDLLYIDSAGLSALVWMWMEARERGAELVLSCNNQRIHRVLEITGLLKIFNLEPNITVGKAIVRKSPTAVAARQFPAGVPSTLPVNGLRRT